MEALISAVRARLDHETLGLDVSQAVWEKRALADLNTARTMWTPVKADKIASSGGMTLTVQEDLSVLGSGTNPSKDCYTITLVTDRKAITGIRLEALTDASHTNKSLSRANGNFVLTGFEVELAGADGAKSEAVKIARAVADYEQPGFPIAGAIDADPKTGWAVDGHARAQNRQAVFTFAKPIPGGAGTTLTVVMKHESPYAGHNIGRFRLALTSADKPGLGTRGLPADIAKLLTVEPDMRTLQEKEKLAAFHRGIAPELAVDRSELARLEDQKRQFVQSFPTTLVSMSVTPRVMRILPRGNWLDESGQIVSPAVPSFLSPLGATERWATRLDLARWLVSRDHPLTARVFVNRLWKLFFGQGLVKTVEDFGTQGTPPTHPELLDWLAVEFMESGWDVKHLIKLMVLSSTYRQSSKASRNLMERDPANLWLARQGRFRIDAEMTRDDALLISALLSPKIGGPSVKPYQPDGYWSLLNFPTREYKPDHGAGQYRRGLYTYWQRTFLHPSLLAFDAPTREECTADRPRSCTPLQALVVLNDPTYVEAARVLAEHILKEGGASDDERFIWAFRRALSRQPKSEETKVLTDLLDRHRKEYAADKEAAKKAIRVGERPVAKDLDPVELAAWTSVARALLNLHETITRN
jgi:hypothetical protein